jgi:hypothetical protein
MKRIVLVAIPLMLAFAFAGCPRSGGTDDSNENSNLNGAANDNSAANENLNLDEGLNDNVNLNGSADLNDNANVNDNANDNGSDDSEPSLFGVWHRTSTETMHGVGDTELDYMVLNEDYTAGFHFRSPSLGVVVCHSGLFLTGPGIMVLALPTLFPGTMMGQYEMADADTLGLMSPESETIVFERVDTLPADYVCGELAITNRYTALPTPHYDSGLAYDGTQLWYTLEDPPSNLQPVDPDTGTPGAPVAALTYPLVQACQGTDFWLIQVGSRKTQLRQPDDTLVDEVDTEFGLATPTTIHAVTYDSDNHVLWIHGADLLGADQMLRVDSDAEPDVLISVEPLDVEIEALAWHSDSLWVLVDADPYIVVQFDPAGLTPVRTYTAPRPQARWRGLAWVGESLYLIGEESGEGVLVQTELVP